MVWVLATGNYNLVVLATAEQLSNTPILSYATNKPHRLQGENNPTYSNRPFSLGNQTHTHNSWARRSVDPHPAWLWDTGNFISNILRIPVDLSSLLFIQTAKQLFHPPTCRAHGLWVQGWNSITLLQLPVPEFTSFFPLLFIFCNPKCLSLLFLFSFFSNKVCLSYLNFVIWNNNDPYKFKT